MSTPDTTLGGPTPPNARGHIQRRWAPIVAAGVAILVAFLLGAVTHRTAVGAGTAPEEIESTRTAPVDGPVSADPPPPPPPNGSTQSFQTSTPRVTIDPDLKAHTFSESCPAGWYVRPGQASAPTPTDVNPAYLIDASSRYIDSEGGDGTSGAVIPNDPYSIFTGFSAKFTNAGISSKHEVQLQYWCDKIPDWYQSTSSDQQNPSPRVPLGIAKSKPVGVGADGRKGGIGPVPYSCYYCSFNFSSLTNASTGLALDWSNADSGGNLIVQNPGGGGQAWYALGQPGGSWFDNTMATFGFWRSDGAFLDDAITENGDGSVTFVNASSGVPPTGGRWYFVDFGAGTAIGGVQLVNTATQHCLAATGGAGSAVVATTCDATDKSQYWLDKS